MKGIVNWLSTPYYFNLSKTYRFYVSICVGFFVFLFLYIFRPFRLSLFHPNDALQYTIALGVIAFLVVGVFLFIFPLIFKKYFIPSEWRIGKSIFLTLSCLIVIGVFCWLYSFLSKEDSSKTDSWFFFILYALSIGFFPIVIYYIVDEKISRKKRQKVVATIKKEKLHRKVSKKKDITSITLTSKNKKEKLTIQLDQLVYVTSDGNYVCFFIKEKEGIKEYILRNTLTNIDASFNGYKNLIRCHKSYIVNSEYMNDIKGNARGYVLISKYVSFSIPVSRNFKKDELKNLIN